MSVKVTVPNNSGDYLTFGSANTPTAAQVGGYDDGSSNGHLEFYTTASGTSTERVRITSAGNVGIATSSPSKKLEVYSTSDSLQINSTVRNDQPGTGVAAIGFNVSSSAASETTSTKAGIGQVRQDSFGRGALCFYNNNTASAGDFTTSDERMRIDSSGVLLVNRTSYASGVTSACKLQVLGTGSDWITQLESSAASPSGIGMKYSGAAPNNTGNEFFYALDTSAVRFVARSNGGLANYSGNNVNLSDAREKTNVELAGSYLDKICAIPVKTFNYVDQNLEEDAGLTLGVIAQEVQAVAPELVMESNWGTKEEPKMRLGIYQTDLQYALMKCIQEQQEIINDLKARIETLEAK